MMMMMMDDDGWAGRETRARERASETSAGVDGRVSVLGRHERERQRAMGDAWERRDGDARMEDAIDAGDESGRETGDDADARGIGGGSRG